MFEVEEEYTREDLLLDMVNNPSMGRWYYSSNDINAGCACSREIDGYLKEHVDYCLALFQSGVKCVGVFRVRRDGGIGGVRNYYSEVCLFCSKRSDRCQHTCEVVCGDCDNDFNTNQLPHRCFGWFAILICNKGHKYPAFIEREGINFHMKSCPCCRSEEIEKIIIDRGGKLHQKKNGFDIIETGTDGKIDITCGECGHLISVTYYQLKDGEWCGCVISPEIKEVRRFALDHGGLCYSSDDKIRDKGLLRWMCRHRHRFDERGQDTLNRNYFCPYCHIDKLEKDVKNYKSLRKSADSKSGDRCVRSPEEMCRYYFETIFDVGFPKLRPKWLKNPKTGKSLELDGYADGIGIAFEFNGKQHYESVEFTGIGKSDVEYQQFKDSVKRLRCQEMGVKLIEIPYTSKGNLLKFILSKLHEHGIIVINSNIRDKGVI